MCEADRDKEESKKQVKHLASLYSAWGSLAGVIYLGIIWLLDPVASGLIAVFLVVLVVLAGGESYGDDIMRTETSVLAEVNDYLSDLEITLGEIDISVSEGHLKRIDALMAVAMESLAEARRVIVLRISETSEEEKGATDEKRLDGSGSAESVVRSGGVFRA